MKVRSPAIELLCLGTELLSGRLNTHQSHLSLELRRAGLKVSRETSLPDDAAAIAREVRSALARCDALLVCGGLGPTFDDVTREGVSAALKKPLVYRPALYAAIKRRFLRRRLSVPEENRRQAFVIAGAEVMPNKRGSAPGQLIELPRLRRGAPRLIALMPGPYAELWPMFKGQVLPRLLRLRPKGAHAVHLLVHLSGIAEAAADESLAAARQEAPEAEFTILASAGQIDFHATASESSRPRARRLLARLRRRVYAAVGDHIFGEGPETLESAAGAALRARGLTLAVAESCTGGMLGSRLTAAAGSSDYFKGGVVAYSNDLKRRLLGVRRGTLARFGAVSAECAREMAEGARRLAASDVGLAVTGIAGPGGGSQAKPVGLVYASMAGPGRRPGVERELRRSGGREVIRQRAAAAALDLLIKRLRPQSC